MNLLLITGAGASKRLGAEGKPMPLMEDWANALVMALEAQESGLAQTCGLLAGSSGPEFEESLGTVLRWEQLAPLHERFLPLGGLTVGSTDGPMQDYLKRVNTRLGVVKATLNRTLYELFGQHRVDDVAASEACRRLLDALEPASLAVATTNYDRSIEAGLEGAGLHVHDGFTQRAGRTRLLNAAGMFSRRGDDTVPVLHLHGAVGWYDSAGTVEDHLADKAFNSTLGTPVVLYPDPDKEPTENALVSQLWAEFREALNWSDHVLVLGHSLHDPALVRELTAAAPRTRIGVTYLTDSDRDQLVPTLGGLATPIQCDFGPEPVFEDPAALAKWSSQ